MMLMQKYIFFLKQTLKNIKKVIQTSDLALYNQTVVA